MLCCSLGWGQQPPAMPIENLPASAKPQPHVWSLGTLEQLALERNPALQQAAAVVSQRRGTWLQAGLYPNPSLNYSSVEVGAASTSGLHQLSLNQQIVIRNKLEYRRQVAAHEIQQAQQRLEQQRLRVLTSVRNGFYQALAYQRLLEVTQKVEKIAEEQVQTIRRLIEAGESSEVDFLQARIEVNNARLRVRDAEAQRYQALRELAAMANLPAEELQHLEGRLPIRFAQLDWQATLHDLWQRSPEVTEAHFALQRAQWRVQVAQAERVADPTVGLGVGYDDGSGDPFANVNVSMPLPWHDRNQGNFRTAIAEVKAAEQNVERVRLNLQQRLAGAFRNYDASRQQVLLYSEELLPDTQKSLDLVREGYRQGQLSYLQLLTAQRAYFQANVGYYQTILTAQTAKVQIDGLLLQNGLQAPQ